MSCLPFFLSSALTAPKGECYHVRQIDGTCNNYRHPELGAGERYLKRGAEGINYVDGRREPVVTPNMRTVSNSLFRGDDSVLSPHGHNLLWTFFGQFITHDTMGVHRKGDLNASEIPDSNNSDIWLRVPLESNDVLYNSDPPSLNPAINYMRILRSRGDFVKGKFEIGSDSTAWLDLDVVYGKNENVTEHLRSFVNGTLISRNYVNYTTVQGAGSTVSAAFVGNVGEWLPTLEDVGDPNRTVVPVSNQLVLTTVQKLGLRAVAAGDGRAGENYGLTVIQALFLREHNRLARQYKAARPNWNDEQIFQAARRVNIAQYQAVVFYEFLPSLLLSETSRLGRYRGYDDDVDPTLTHLFAFAFRFGHTTVPNTYYLRNQCNIRPFNSTRDGPRSGQSFGGQMHTDQIAQVGTAENILHALLFTNGSKVDVQFPESLRTIRGAVSDIIVQNQMRAAEHGLPGYGAIRKLWHGAPHPDLYDYPFCASGRRSTQPDPLACFQYINSNVTVATKLRDLYGKVGNINFYTAVVAEEPRLAAIGQTSARIVADQFRRLRDGDRWWFEGDDAGFSRSEIKDMVRNMRLSTLFRRNFPNANVQDDAFYTPKASFFNNCS